MTKRNMFIKLTNTNKWVRVSLCKIITMCVTIGLLHSSFILHAGQKSFTSQDVTKKGKDLEQTIAQWSGAANAKSIFVSASDPSHTNRVKNVFDGDNYLPNAPVTRTKIDPKTQKSLIDPATKKPQTETVTAPRLAWTKDLVSIQSFIKAFAPKSDVLNKAWYNIVAADRILQETLEAANTQKNTSTAEKMYFFEAMIPVLTNIRNSLSETFKAVSSTRMWFYDTEASKALMLATIPIISTALQRVITDYTLLKQEGQAKQIKPLSKTEQDKVNQEKGPYVKSVVELFKNRDQDTSGLVSVSELKRLRPELFVGSKKSVSTTPKPTIPESPTPPEAPVTPLAPAAPAPARVPQKASPQPEKDGRKALLESIQRRRKD